MDCLSRGQEAKSSFWTFALFDCWSSNNETVFPRHSAVPSVMRELHVLDQQPHLVEPMKLRVYEDLPSTPMISEPSHLSQWGRNLASRASSRTSKISMRRRTTSKSFISKPLPFPEMASDVPLVRRRREFTPLQLSIYVDTNRLSDLPEFDRLSFTDEGELKRPTKALTRTQSEDMLRTCPKLVVEVPKRVASMYETGNTSTFTRPSTSRSIVSTSRPPSEHDALHSHPVSWSVFPGLTAAKSQKVDNLVAVMTPMQEEFSPVTPAVTVDGTLLRFPTSTRPAATTVDSDMASLLPEQQAPYPTVGQGPSATSTMSKAISISRGSFTRSQSHTRVSQWLHHRVHSSSASTTTVGSGTTASSFLEHRRKRSDFYKLGQQTQLPPTTSASAPQPLNFSNRFPVRVHHQRTNTESTVRTVSTSVLSTVFDNDCERSSEESVTVYSSADPRSRTGTMKSVTSPCSPTIITPEKRRIVLTPPMSGEVVNAARIYLSEINGPLRSPGVGVAF